MQVLNITEMLPRRSISVKISYTVIVSKLEYVFFCRSFWKNEQNEAFLITHFHCKNYLLSWVTILPWFWICFCAFCLTRKSLQIITLLKLAFFQSILCFFSSTISCWNPCKFQVCFYTLLKHSSCKCPTCLYLWNRKCSKWQISILILTYPRRNILLFQYTRTHDLT